MTPIGSIALALVAQVAALPAPDPRAADAASTAALNVAVHQHDAAVAATAAAAQAAYAADLARFHAAQADYDRAREAAAAAADAYRRDRAGYEQALEDWRAKSRPAERAAPPRPQAAARKRVVCEDAAPTGSHLTRRVCREE